MKLIVNLCIASFIGLALIELALHLANYSQVSVEDTPKSLPHHEIKGGALTNDKVERCLVDECRFIARFVHPNQGVICMVDYTSKPLVEGPPERFDIYNRKKIFAYKEEFRLSQRVCSQVNEQLRLKEQFFAPAQSIFLATSNAHISIDWFTSEETL
jgi:hypothetical protein